MSPVVLITGVTSGIGRATAAYLASRQMQVFGTVPEPVDGLQQHPDGYHIMTMDVRDDAAVRQAVGAIMGRARRCSGEQCRRRV
jgi:NAD(P)-dependent dehydrogenase (short-subunit alcohol dehydrogenase family)